MYYCHRLVYPPKRWSSLIDDPGRRLKVVDHYLRKRQARLMLFWPMARRREADLLVKQALSKGGIDPSALAETADGIPDSLRIVELPKEASTLPEDDKVRLLALAGFGLVSRCFTCGRMIPTAHLGQVVARDALASVASSCDQCGRAISALPSFGILQYSAGFECVDCHATMPPHVEGCSFDLRGHTTAVSPHIYAGAE